MENVRLILGGDLMLARGVNNMIRREGTGYPFKNLPSFVKNTDIFFANLECALSSSKTLYKGPEKMFYFRADPECIEILIDAGINAVSLANNHILDADETGLAYTIELLDKYNIAHAGAGMDKNEAAQPAIIKKKGIKIGIIAFCDHQEDFAADAKKPGIQYAGLSDLRSSRKITTQIQKLTDLVDIVVVSLHWQGNWASTLEKQYRSIAAKLVEAGAGIIWGHGPHHFQGVEWINEVPVIYSSGDLLNDYTVDPEFRNDLQLLFEVELDNQGVNHLRAFPLKLKYAETSFAKAPAEIAWISKRLNHYCGTFDSHVTLKNGYFEFRQTVTSL